MDRIWDEAERERQAAVARKHRIWEQSTGPKTEEGKERSRMNAMKHGMRSKAANITRGVLAEHTDILRHIKNLVGVELSP